MDDIEFSKPEVRDDGVRIVTARKADVSTLERRLRALRDALRREGTPTALEALAADDLHDR